MGRGLCHSNTFTRSVLPLGGTCIRCKRIRNDALPKNWLTRGVAAETLNELEDDVKMNSGNFLSNLKNSKLNVTLLQMVCAQS